MKLNRFTIFCLCLFFGLATAAAQDGDEPKKIDPTSPSPEIVKQEDAIRGMERLKELEKELARVNKLLEKLISEGEDTAAQLKRKDKELADVRNEVKQKQVLREAIPAFRLLSLVQTDARSIAVIGAGDRAYRLRDKQRLTLELSTGAKVQVTCSIKSADSVELEIPELSMTELVSFQPKVD